jgi:site-specific DNA-methyltransferase (adenine-specific)
MREMPEASIDAIVTDPPYGLVQNKRGGSGVASVDLSTPYGRARIGAGNGPGGFMGKAWDSCVPGVEFWREALRVTKPGGHLVAFGGTRTFHRLACAIEDAGWEVRDCLSWLYGSGFPKSKNLDGAWQGWGTALKPAWEPIILARKPLGGTVAANVLAHGTGALNIDGCRVGLEGKQEHWDAYTPSSKIGFSGGSGTRIGGAYNPAGRWPANVAIDEEAAAMLDAQSGNLGKSSGGFTPGSTGAFGKHGVYGAAAGQDTQPGYGDSGGASRFFYCAKASRKERGEGNTHLAVKPLALMRWLCRLVCPPGGTILDPFAGSGTTLLAAGMEGLGAVGIERDPTYFAIAKKRLGIEE